MVSLNGTQDMSIYPRYLLGDAAYIYIRVLSLSAGY